MLSLLDAQGTHILWQVVQHLNLVQTIPFFIWIALPTNVDSHKPILHPKRWIEECYLGWKAKTLSWEVSELRLFASISLPLCECVRYNRNCMITYLFSQNTLPRSSQKFENSQ